MALRILLISGAAGLCLAGFAALAAPAHDWLAVCSKCMSPTVIELTGAGTANAQARARITQAEVKGWCEQWQPGDASCVRQNLNSSEAKQDYRASANCPAGQLTAVDGQRYTLAGVWPGGDIGAGRVRFRDAGGRIVDRSNAANGLGLAQNWEVLCPGIKQAGAARPAAPPAAGIQAAYSVGQIVEARYGSEWVRARVNAIRLAPGPNKGANGPEPAYDVSLANGKHGVVPGRMLRPAP